MLCSSLSVAADLSLYGRYDYAQKGWCGTPYLYLFCSVSSGVLVSRANYRLLVLSVGALTITFADWVRDTPVLRSG